MDVVLFPVMPVAVGASRMFDNGARPRQTPILTDHGHSKC